MKKRALPYLILLLAITLFLESCLLMKKENETPEVIQMDNTYTVCEGCPLKFRDLNIGYYRTDYRKFVDQQGETQQGYIAGLGMFLTREGPSSGQYFELYAGQEIDYRGYKIKVIDIWNCGSAFRVQYCIRLLINPTESQATPITSVPPQTPRP